MFKMFSSHETEIDRVIREEKEERERIAKLNEYFFLIPTILKDIDSLVYTLGEIRENLKHSNTKYIYEKTPLSVSDIDYAFKTFIQFLRSLRKLDIDLLIGTINKLPRYYRYPEDGDAPANILLQRNYDYIEFKGALFIPFVISGIRNSEDEFKKIKSFYDLYMLIGVFSSINELDTTVSEALKEQAKAIRYIVEIYIDIYKTHIKENIS